MGGVNGLGAARKFCYDIPIDTEKDKPSGYHLKNYWDGWGDWNDTMR